MAKLAEVLLLTGMDKLSSYNDIWGNTIALGLSTSSPAEISINSNNFKYWLEITVKSCDDESLPIGIFSTVARPRDLSGLLSGYGAISIGPLVKSQLFSSPTGDVGDEVYAITQSQVSKWYNYPDFLFPVIRTEWYAGYSYNPNIDVEAIVVNVGGTDYLGFTMSAINPFVAAGNIFVTSENPYINGNHTIFGSALATYSFATTTLYSATMSSATPLGRIVSYFSPADVGEIERYGFDGTQDYKQYGVSYDYLIVDGTLNDYLDGGSFNFLSNYPNRRTGTSSIVDSNLSSCLSIAKRVRRNSYETISVILDGGVVTSGNDFYAEYKTYDDNLNFLGGIYKLFNNAPSCPEPGKLFRVDFPLGTINNNLSTNVKYFSIQLVEEVGPSTYDPLTELRYFYIDDTCSIYDSVNVMFKNKFGAWEYFVFTQDNKKMFKISRDEVKKEPNWGEIQNANFKGFRGRQVIASNVEEEHTLNSNWITETEYEWLSELMQSNDVYILENYVGSNIPYPVPIMITDTSYEFKTAYRDQIFNLTINYKYAFPRGSQTQ